MPRRKSKKASPSKSVDTENVAPDAAEVEETPAVVEAESDGAEYEEPRQRGRSRRRSTVAQTTASEAGARATRSVTRTPSSESPTPPTKGRGAGTSETPALRVKQSRRGTKVSYQEDSEEEANKDEDKPEEEDEFHVDDEEMESDSEESRDALKRKGRSKPAATPRAKRSKRPSGGRGRPSASKSRKAKKVEEDFEEEEDDKDDTEYVAESKPSGRKRKAKKPVEAVDSDVAETGRSRRGKAKVAESGAETASPMRRSGRARKTIMEDVKGTELDEEEEEEEEEEEVIEEDEDEEAKVEVKSKAGRKKKADDEVAVPSKKQKLETSEDKPEETKMETGDEEDDKPEPKVESGGEAEMEEESEKPEDETGDDEDTAEEVKIEKVEDQKPPKAEEVKKTEVATDEDDDDKVEKDTSKTEVVTKSPKSSSSPVLNATEKKPIEVATSSPEKATTDIPSTNLSKPVTPQASPVKKTDVSPKSMQKNSPSAPQNNTKSPSSVTDTHKSSPAELSIQKSPVSQNSLPLSATPVTQPPEVPKPHVNSSNEQVINGNKEKSTGVDSAKVNDNIKAASNLPGRNLVSKITKEDGSEAKFSTVSFNLAGDKASGRHDKLLLEIKALNGDLLCLQEVPQEYYKNVLQSSLELLGYKGVLGASGVGTFYKFTTTCVLQKEVDLKDVVKKDIQMSGLDEDGQVGVNKYLQGQNLGKVQCSQLKVGDKMVFVANVHLGHCEISTHALQVSCIVRELMNQADSESNSSQIISGTFNMEESCPGYQLIRDGYLSNDMIETLQKQKHVQILNKENAALVNLMWKSFQHSASQLKSSYVSILGHELAEKTGDCKISSNSIWYSSDTLLTNAVLDVDKTSPDTIERPSLKAHLSFIN